MGYNQFIGCFLFMCLTDKMNIPQSGTSDIRELINTFICIKIGNWDVTEHELLTVEGLQFCMFVRMCHVMILELIITL